MKVLLDNGHGENTPGKRSPKWSDGSQLFEWEYAREIAKKEGILVGISTGASLAAVAKKAATLPDDAKILTFNYDTGERYLSIEGLF